MKNVILLTLLSGNGGISSWSRKFIKTFKSDEYHIIPIDRFVKGRDFYDNSLWSRFSAGIKELVSIVKLVKKEIKNTHIDMLHTTTSGSLGTFRDCVIGWICKKNNIKCIMHCRYGCITEDLHSGMYGRFLRYTMGLYNQVWVLDSRSVDSIKKFDKLRDRVYLTPNSIEVSDSVEICPKSYKHIAFIGNLVPSKGLYELVEAVCRVKYDIKLSIVGRAEDDVAAKIEELSSINPDRVNMLGLLPNEDAVKFMSGVDVLALPTYYPWEAFPISILEAMSLGKLVISTPRAAIKDMLTALDGTKCGILVKEKSVDEIVKAIEWCVENPHMADELCKKAYEKVYKAYRMSVIYDLYKELYGKL